MNKLIMKLRTRITCRFVGKLNALIRRTHWYNETYWRGAAKFWYHNTFGLDVVNTGSNTGKFAFDYSGCGIRGFNMALGPQSLVHDFNILKNYFSYLKMGATVIIPLCPFSCLHSEYGRDANFKYYTFLHPATIIGFEDGERTRALKIRDNPFGMIPRTCVKALCRELWSKVASKFRWQLTKGKDFETSTNVFLKGWMMQFSISDLSAPLTHKHLDEFNQRAGVLRDMIDFCVERSFKPILVIPPMHKTLTKRFPTTFIENYVDDFVRAVNRPDVQFYNDMAIDLPDDCFENALFLNRKGAKCYTREFLRREGLL